MNEIVVVGVFIEETRVHIMRCTMATGWRRRAIRYLVSSLLVLLIACAVLGSFVTQEVYVSRLGQRVVVGPYIIRTGTEIEVLSLPPGNLVARFPLGVPIVQVQVRSARGVPIKGERYTLLVGPVRVLKL
jgi:hypothetical protein